jgi:hypothetical protein
MPTADQREYYARRAAEVRALAKVATEPDMRMTLETMAESHDTLVTEAGRIALMRPAGEGLGQPAKLLFSNSLSFDALSCRLSRAVK